MHSQWKDKIWNSRGFSFSKTALEIFHFQLEHNIVYREYVNALSFQTGSIRTISEIPFLPIRFFKTHEVKSALFDPEVIFESSGTTGITTSRHYIKETTLYKESFMRGFELFYGSPKNWCIIGLLPSYLERKNSSLVYMVSELIRESKNPDSGFYLNQLDELAVLLKRLEIKKQKTLLIGVTFALLDFAEKYPMPLKHTTIMETGGMKGRRKELIREEIHDILKKAFEVKAIHSEYGMTELLSQAYSKGNGNFSCPPWMQVLVRDDEDLLLVKNTGSGAINIIDLANIHSCSFIATDDFGKVFADGSFHISGRIDNSDLRGCSLMAI